jgi:ribonuclease G
MSKEIIVNADVRETRIAVREDNQLVELYFEREERVVGNVYKGRVENVPQSLDAAFVDIGLERNSYLSVSDYIGDDGGEGDAKFDRRGRRTSTDSQIKDVLKRGQEILVQVTKGARGTKGSRISTRISLPGRFLVFMPDEHSTGVSRKIDDPRERDRLKRVVDGIRKPGYGLIVRTEAEGKSERELRQDLEYLESTWNEIRTKAAITPAPNLVYADSSLLVRILRDGFGSDVDKLILDSPEDYRKTHELLDFFGPNLKDRVELYDQEKPIFEHYNIESEMKRLLERNVPLKSGGYLIIDQAEALVAIDVNSGKFTGHTTGLRDTILQTNLEAAAEIARQLRLRDLGGIIILDLIDMDTAQERKRVELAFDAALKGDRTRCNVGHISSLGLIEMTRKRTGETLTEQTDDACPYCNGTGHITSPDSVAHDLARDLIVRLSKQPSEAFLVTCHPLVAAHLVGEEGESIEALEHRLQRGLYIRTQDDFHIEKYDVQLGKLDDLDRKQMPFTRNQIIDVEVVRDPRSLNAGGIGVAENGMLVELEDAGRFIHQKIRVRLTKINRSIAFGELLNRPREVPTPEPPSGRRPAPPSSGGPRNSDKPRNSASGGDRPRNNRPPVDPKPKPVAPAPNTSPNTGDDKKRPPRRRRSGIKPTAIVATEV